MCYERKVLGSEKGQFCSTNVSEDNIVVIDVSPFVWPLQKEESDNRSMLTSAA